MKYFLLLILTVPLFCIGQETHWIKSFGGAESDKGISIGTDSLGFVYVSGYFNTSADFGTINLTNNNPIGTNKEAFLMKLDSLGDVIWAIAGGNLNGGCCDDRALGMHVTPGGDVFFTGTFWSSFNIGVCSTGGNNADTSVLTKIDSDGNCVWVIAFGANEGGFSPACTGGVSAGDDHSYDVKVDDDGFIYVTGFFSGNSADFDTFSIQNENWVDNCTPMGYVGKLDSDANWLWVDKFDGIYDNRGSRDNRIAIDAFSNVYVTGGFENTGNYGPLSLESEGEYDVFLFKMDKDGNWIWVQNVGSNKSDRGNGIAIDRCNDIYINGEYRNPMEFAGANASNGTSTLSHKQKRDVFVAKCNSDGDWIWAKRARSSGVDKPYQMFVDQGKQVYICGTTSDTTIFNDDVIVYPPNVNDITNSAFVAQLDGSGVGEWQWAKVGGSLMDDDDRTNDICADGFGNVYAVGFYENEANFDGITLISQGKKDIFVWKLRAQEKLFNYTNTYDTTTINNLVCDISLVDVFLTRDTLVSSCDTTFIDTITNYVLDPNIQLIRYTTQLYDESCFAQDTGLFVIYSDTTYFGCDTILVDTLNYVSLLPSDLDYSFLIIQDSTCSPLDTGLFLTLSEADYNGCDTSIYEEFIHYTIMQHPDCDDGNCKTTDTYDEIRCECRHEEFLVNNCLEFIFPTAFTPNLDGRNDYYYPVVYNPHLIQEYQLWIYDRWGNLIFNTTNIYEGWDSSNLPLGVYSWRMNVVELDGKTQGIVGQVSLLR
jgi:gliding motility-associated-like protein